MELWTTEIDGFLDTGDESYEKTAEMLHIHKSFHFHAGRWLQSGCPERKT